jgi:hypothetical protein
MTTDELPVARAIHRKKKRSAEMHWFVADCPFCRKSHSARALGAQRSECVGCTRMYRVVSEETTDIPG